MESYSLKKRARSGGGKKGTKNTERSKEEDSSIRCRVTKTKAPGTFHIVNV